MAYEHTETTEGASQRALEQHDEGIKDGQRGARKTMQGEVGRLPLVQGILDRDDTGVVKGEGGGSCATEAAWHQNGVR
jgi:hypothetical protein